MAANTTWTVRLTVRVTAPADTVITENAATTAATPDPNLTNSTATVSLKVQKAPVTPDRLPVHHPCAGASRSMSPLS